nr:MAG TPA: hypothetical protein [Caudoviricetes sp.]
MRPSHQRSKLRQRAAKSRILFIIIVCLKTLLCSTYIKRAGNKEHAAIFYLSDLLFIFAPIIQSARSRNDHFKSY